MALTQTQLATAIADRAQLSNADAKRALAALDEVVLDELGNAEKVRIGGLVQLTVRVKPAQTARTGRNPATGEEITIAAKPASVDVRARALARAKGALIGPEGASSARRLNKPAVPPASPDGVGQSVSAAAADTRRAAGAANGTPVAADRPSVRSSRTSSAAPGPVGSHDRAGHDITPLETKTTRIVAGSSDRPHIGGP